MKIKVDKKEYEQLLVRAEQLSARVEHLERYNANSLERFRWLEKEFRDYIENYFTDRCRVVMMKRDKDEIIAELRSQAIDNIFKVEE